jgi:hypothetical protein
MQQVCVDTNQIATVLVTSYQLDKNLFGSELVVNDIIYDQLKQMVGDKIGASFDIERFHKFVRLVGEGEVAQRPPCFLFSPCSPRWRRPFLPVSEPRSRWGAEVRLHE